MPVPLSTLRRILREPNPGAILRAMMAPRAPRPNFGLQLVLWAVGPGAAGARRKRGVVAVVDTPSGPV